MAEKKTGQPESALGWIRTHGEIIDELDTHLGRFRAIEMSSKRLVDVTNQANRLRNLSVALDRWLDRYVAEGRVPPGLRGWKE